MSTIKSILVLARRDHAEAMRVAAGLTIFGHQVGLVFMREAVAETEECASISGRISIQLNKKIKI